MAETEKVQIHGKPYIVTLTQTSNTVWIASGRVGPIAGIPPEEGRDIDGKGSSRSSALADWVRNAKYWLN